MTGPGRASVAKSFKLGGDHNREDPTPHNYQTGQLVMGHPPEVSDFYGRFEQVDNILKHFVHSW